jgi:hypothetical protein
VKPGGFHKCKPGAAVGSYDRAWQIGALIGFAAGVIPDPGQGPGLRGLARARASPDIHRRPHHPRQDLQTRQPLPACPIRASGVGCADQAADLAASRAQALDRGRQKAAAPQCACDCPCQQARPYRLERSCSRPRLRGEQASSCVIIRESSRITDLPRSARGRDEMEVRSSRHMRTLVTHLAQSRPVR